MTCKLAMSINTESTFSSFSVALSMNISYQLIKSTVSPIQFNAPLSIPKDIRRMNIRGAHNYKLMLVNYFPGPRQAKNNEK